MKLSFKKVENTSRKVLKFFKDNEKTLEKYPLLSSNGDYFELLYKEYLRDKNQTALLILLKAISKIHIDFYIESQKGTELMTKLMGSFLTCTDIFEKKPYSTIFGNTIKEEIMIAEQMRDEEIINFNKDLKNN